MIIELQRAFSPEVVEERTCGICGQRFDVESVVAQVMTDWRMDLNWACASCIEYLGRRNPERFPGIEEYEAAKQRYPEPIWASEEDLLQAEEEDADAYEAACQASWIPRARPLVREVWQRLGTRGDILNDAFTLIEDLTDEQIGGYSRQQLLAVLAEERDKRWEEWNRFKAGLGVRN